VESSDVVDVVDVAGAVVEVGPGVVVVLGPPVVGDVTEEPDVVAASSSSGLEMSTPGPHDADVKIQQKLSL
jgi:hypothetical protein